MTTEISIFFKNSRCRQWDVAVSSKMHCVNKNKCADCTSILIKCKSAKLVVWEILKLQATIRYCVTASCLILSARIKTWRAEWIIWRDHRGPTRTHWSPNSTAASRNWRRGYKEKNGELVHIDCSVQRGWSCQCRPTLVHSSIRCWAHSYHFPPAVVRVRVSVAWTHWEGVELQEAAMWSLGAFALRDNNSLQQTNRKLERKVKEMKMQADEEHVSLQNERDQVGAPLLLRDKVK